jgi:prepilin-type N-terminal cleavage/methylation domain-containing protein
LVLNAVVRSKSRPTADPRRALDGFTLVEVLAALAIIVSVTGALSPSLLDYWRTASVQAGARELASAINLARQLAIARRVSVCVDLAGTGLRLRMGGCHGPHWTGSMTDASGVIRIGDATTVAVAANARVVFTPLGAAIPGGTYTVAHTTVPTSRTIVVAASGRISLE